MKGYDFVFSNKRGARMLRHLVFWLTCWLYGSLTFYFLQQAWISPGGNSKYVNLGTFVLLKNFLLILTYIAPCYFFINVILPALITRKWVKAISILLPLAYLMYTLGWFMYWRLFPFVDKLFGLPGENQYYTKFWPAVVLGLIDPIKIIAAAAIIKYGKHWWNRQKEKEKLEQEKWNTELQLLKAQISPGFLFTSLDNIYEYALKTSPLTPELLLKLSDLLSYMLYECDATFVSLEKEIERMKDFIALEKLRLNEKVEIGLTVTGDMNGVHIAPFLLLPFIEYSFKQSANNLEQAWVNMEIGLTGDMFTMKLANGMNPSSNDLSTLAEADLTNVKKRLSLLYPQKHELKISRESEMLLVHLKIITTSVLEQSQESYQLSLI